MGEFVLLATTLMMGDADWMLVANPKDALH